MFVREKEEEAINVKAAPNGYRINRINLCNLMILRRSNLDSLLHSTSASSHASKLAFSAFNITINPIQSEYHHHLNDCENKQTEDKDFCWIVLWFGFGYSHLKLMCKSRSDFDEIMHLIYVRTTTSIKCFVNLIATKSIVHLSVWRAFLSNWNFIGTDDDAKNSDNHG